MNKTIRALQQRKAQAVAGARGIIDAAAKEDRDLTDDESKQYDAFKADIDSLAKRIEREQDIVDQEKSAGIVVADNARITIEENIDKDPKRGFANFGDFAQAVRSASTQGGHPDRRLVIGAAAPGTFGNEAVGADGGFLIPPEFAQTIFTHSLGEDSLLAMTDNYNIGSNSMVFPKDETTPWGTDGIRAYWQVEASAATATKPKLSTTTLRMHKLMALVPLTDELLADGPTLAQYLTKKVGDSIRWKTNEAILFGSGNGTPLGALSGNAAIVVVKESGQATLTLQALNLAKMVARLPSGSFGRAVWLINNDVLPALFTLTLGNYPIYLPGGTMVGGMQINPYGTLLGRPIIVSQHASSFTNQGDVQLHDLSYYRSITKAGGVETATSMHLYFDADATAFRTTFRVDGQPTIVNPIAPAKGTNNLSPFIQLGAR